MQERICRRQEREESLKQKWITSANIKSKQEESATGIMPPHGIAGFVMAVQQCALPVW